jgi:hypothetical protein
MRNDFKNFKIFVVFQWRLLYSWFYYYPCCPYILSMLYSASIQRNSWHILIAIVSLRIEADLNGIGILAVLSGAECPAHCVIERRDMMDSNSAKRVDFEIKGGQLLIGLRAGMVW